MFNLTPLISLSILERRKIDKKKGAKPPS